MLSKVRKEQTNKKGERGHFSKAFQQFVIDYFSKNSIVIKDSTPICIKINGKLGVVLAI